MIFWIIITIITFFFLRWVIKVPHLTSKRIKILEGQPGYSKYSTNYNFTYAPIGMKIWTFALLILVSLTPILNIIGILAGILYIIIQRDFAGITWDEVFPNGQNKFLTFLNKPLK